MTSQAREVTYIIDQRGRKSLTHDTFYKNIGRANRKIMRKTQKYITVPLISDGIVSQEKYIFVCHCPPSSVGLGNIDKDTDVGSNALYKWIETTQPLLTLHGHIHESPQVTGYHTAKIGHTTVHQPGQQKPQERLVYSIVSIKGSSVDVERHVK